jgi:hypothetical protein
MAEGNGQPSSELPAKTGTAEDHLEAHLKTISGVLLNALDFTSKLADKGPVNVMTAVGALLMPSALFFKVKFADHTLVDLTTGEFISLLIVGSILLVTAASMRIYQYRTRLELIREQQNIAAGIVGKTTQAGMELVRQQQDFAAAEAGRQNEARQVAKEKVGAVAEEKV